MVAWVEEIAGKSGKLLLSLDPEARKVWEEYYQTIPKDVYAVRLDTCGFRLMLLLALCKRETVVSTETVRQTTSILNYEYLVRKFYCPIDAETLFSRVEQKIERELEKRGPLKARDLRRFTNAKGVGLWIFRQSLAKLREVGDIALDAKSHTYYTTVSRH